MGRHDIIFGLKSFEYTHCVLSRVRITSVNIPLTNFIVRRNGKEVKLPFDLYETDRLTVHSEANVTFKGEEIVVDILPDVMINEHRCPEVAINHGLRCEKYFGHPGIHSADDPSGRITW